MNRLLELVSSRPKNKKLFCAFLTLGYPSLTATKTLVRELEKAGVDILELGIPFSDPLADGPTIQFSSEQALKKGVCLEDGFQLLKQLRKEGLRMPVVCFTYFNPVFHYGVSRFARQAKASGFDGVIVPDLLPGTEDQFEREAASHQLCQVFLVSPTTSPARARKIAKKSQGFIYYVSLKGVTGARKALPVEISRHLKELKKAASKPVLAGFGVSDPLQAKKLSKAGDGVIVGSAIIDKIRQSGGKTGPAVKFVRDMVAAIKSVSREA